MASPSFLLWQLTLSRTRANSEKEGLGSAAYDYFLVHPELSSGFASETGMAPAQNHLLSQLPRNVRARMLHVAQTVALNLKEVLYPGGKLIDYVYFPVSGFVSLITLIEQRPALEVGMIGSEGVLGARLALGATIDPLRAVVQGSGVAWRMSRVEFIRELAHSAALARLIRLYLDVTMTQVTNSAACTRFHGIGPRLARWLLMTHDRSHADSFRVTHEFLAYMLGVRRGGITIAASHLRARGLNYVSSRPVDGP